MNVKQLTTEQLLTLAATLELGFKHNGVDGLSRAFDGSSALKNQVLDQLNQPSVAQALSVTATLAGCALNLDPAPHEGAEPQGEADQPEATEGKTFEPTTDSTQLLALTLQQRLALAQRELSTHL